MNAFYMGAGARFFHPRRGRPALDYEDSVFSAHFKSFVFMAVDLHMHSNRSDGASPPAALARLCRENGVVLMSLTDHDTMAGTAEAAEAARALGIGFIPGVEISSLWAETSIHVVGLGIDPASATAKARFEASLGLRERRAREMAAAFERLGIRGSYEGACALAQNKANISRTHFARWLLNEGHVPNYQAAFDHYLAQGCPCYVPTRWPAVAETVAFIHSEGGVAVLAHPGRYRLPVAWGIEALLEHFKDAGGDAIEVTSGSQPPEDEPFFAAAAKRFGFLASTGSDWHSARSSRPTPGRQDPLPPGLDPVWTRFGYPRDLA